MPRSYERLGGAFDREKWFAKPYAFALFFRHPLLNVGLFFFFSLTNLRYEYKFDYN